MPEPDGPPRFFTPRREIEDMLCQNRLRISPLSFYQVNRRQAERLYETAAAMAGLSVRQNRTYAGDAVFDLCCGIGSIALFLARLCGRVYGAEINPHAIENARINAGLNNIRNVSWKCGDAAAALRDWTDAGVRPRLVCVDPPRAGLDGRCGPPCCAQRRRRFSISPATRRPWRATAARCAGTAMRWPACSRWTCSRGRRMWRR